MSSRNSSKVIFLSVILISVAIACSRDSGKGSAEEPESAAETVQEESVEELSPALTMVWETDTVLTTVESVLYDPENDRIFASCIDGNPTDKDGRGFISILDKSGSIVNLEWANGLNAPKGMAILNERLYVTDIDRLTEIDLATGEILNFYPVEGAAFLNDVTTDGKAIWFSDMGNGKVHVFSNGEIITFKENLPNLNGVAATADGTVYGLYEKGLIRLDANGEQQIINSVVTNGDGLVIIDEDTFLASRWEGEIYLINGGREYLLLDTRAQSAQSADIGWLPEESVILVPTFFRNKVVAYRLSGSKE